MSNPSPSAVREILARYDELFGCVVAPQGFVDVTDLSDLAKVDENGQRVPCPRCSERVEGPVRWLSSDGRAMHPACCDASITR